MWEDDLIVLLNNILKQLQICNLPDTSTVNLLNIMYILSTSMPSLKESTLGLTLIAD